jgi:hypothetical protein
MKIASFFLFLISLSFLACNSANKALPLDENGREDFQAFHAKFYSDSLFQIRRIEFPLLGNDPDGNIKPFYWELDNWKFKKAVNAESDKIKVLPIFDMEDVMRERIIIQDAFMIENLFSLIDNKWYLTRYSGMRDLAFFAPKPVQKEVLPEVVIDSLE